MSSLIDPTKPTAVAPTTQSVRDNFATAKSEIETLQTGKAAVGGNAAQNFATLDLTVSGVGAYFGASSSPILAAANSGSGVNFIAGHTTPETIGGTACASQNHNSGSISIGVSRWIANSGGVIVATLKSRSSTKGTRATLVNNDVLYQLNNYGVDASGTPADALAAQMSVEVDAAPAAGVVQGRYVFSTANSAGVLTDAMKINSAQLVTALAGLSVSGGVLDLPNYTTGTRPTAATGNMIYDTTLNKACIGTGAGTWQVITSA